MGLIVYRFSVEYFHFDMSKINNTSDSCEVQKRDWMVTDNKGNRTPHFSWASTGEEICPLISDSGETMQDVFPLGKGTLDQLIILLKIPKVPMPSGYGCNGYI